MALHARTIVVGYDGSEASRRALDAAADLVGYGSRLSVVTVSTGPRDGDVVRGAREHLQLRHVEATYDERVGDPAEQLVDAAASVAADLVVVGRRSGRLRRLLGSVSGRVVRAAPCDVLVVR